MSDSTSEKSVPIGRYTHYGKKHLFEMCEIQTDMVSRGSSLVMAEIGTQSAAALFCYVLRS